MTKDWFHSSVLWETQSHLKLALPSLIWESVKGCVTVCQCWEERFGDAGKILKSNREGWPRSNRYWILPDGGFFSNRISTFRKHGLAIAVPGWVWGSTVDVIRVGVAGGEVWPQSDWCRASDSGNGQRCLCEVAAWALCRWRDGLGLLGFFLSASCPQAATGHFQRGHAAWPGYKQNTCDLSSGLVSTFVSEQLLYGCTTLLWVKLKEKKKRKRHVNEVNSDE